jgi:hypothetical protein
VEALGIEAGDVAGVIEWSATPGPVEAGVRRAATDLLTLEARTERAAPGSSAWKRRHDALIGDFLASADPERPELVRGRAIERERQDGWARRQGKVRRRLFTAVLADLAEPIAPPEDVALLVEPLMWLTAEVGTGTRVSSTGTLNRAMVQRIAARYGFAVSGRLPQSEAHVLPVTVLRQLARRMGLVRRQGTTLAATALGRRLAPDAAGMWQRLVDCAADLRDFDRCVAETWLAAQVVLGPLDWPEDRDIAARAAFEEGWQTHKGAPPTREDTDMPISVIAWTFRVTGMFGPDGFGGSGRDEELIPAGRTTALAILRQASMRPSPARPDQALGP